MLSQWIRTTAESCRHAAVVDRHHSLGWGDLVRATDQYVGLFEHLRHARVALAMQATGTSLAALAAFDELQADLFLFDGRLDIDKQLALASDLQLDAIVTQINATEPQIVSLSDTCHGSGTSSVTILTSGTTGKPKAAKHTWSSLARPIRRTASPSPQRWLLSYQPHLYAGLQVLLQCILNGGTLVIDDSHGDINALIRLMVERQVEYVSATPSYWRRLFLLGDPTALRSVPLVQITLGGEVVDEVILNLLSDAFPSARIIHIYATTELGRCFSVTDRKPGFPERFLHQVSPDGIALRVDEDGELLVQSANRMLAYDAASAGGVTTTADGWTRTGDLVEIRDGRVLFVGRRTDLMNVGGNKVSPLRVEQILREIPGVGDVRVFPKGSSIAGQLVACEIVPLGTTPVDELRRRIGEHCREHLASHERPRLVTFVDQIELTSAGKTRRVSSDTATPNKTSDSSS